MIAPGMTFFADGRANTTTGAALVADFVNEGVGFMNDGSVAFDSDPPVGDHWKEGTRLNDSGAIYITGVTDPSDVYLSGLRHTTIGQLIIEAGVAPTDFVNGNPITPAGLFASR